MRCRGADKGLASETATGVQLFYLSRIMGTSVEMIGAAYGHLVPDSEEYLCGLLDNFDAESSDQLTECGD